MLATLYVFMQMPGQDRILYVFDLYNKIMENRKT